MANDKPQLHASMMDTLSRCGEQFRRRYGKLFGHNDREEIIPPSGVLITGIATHKTIEENLKHMIEEGRPLSTEYLADFAHDAASALWNGEVRLDPDDGEDIKTARGDSIDTAVNLSVLHAEELAPKLSPKAVERKWVINLSGFPYDLAGTIDIEEHGGVIRDTKTAKRKPNQDAADDSQQLTMYSLAKKVCDGTEPTALYLDNLVKTKQPQLVVLKTQRTDADRAMLLRRIERATKIIEAGAFQPALPTDWICSEKWCGYWSTCPFASRKKQFSV